MYHSLLALAISAFLGGALLALPMMGSAGGTGTGANGGSGSAAGGVVGKRISASEATAAAAYWTPQRMQAAKPISVTAPGLGPRAASDTQAAPTGPARAVAGSGGGEQSVSAPEPAGFSYPFPFTRYQVYPTSLWKQYPWRVNGKLFFSQNGSNFVCSATSVVAPSLTRVYTAGHCVSDGTSTFSTNVVFVPAYNGNSTNLSVQRPYGTWTAGTLSTTSAWHVNSDLGKDVGSFTTNLLNGVKLGNRVGTAGFAWNQARDQQFVSTGYPQAAPFNGKNMNQCLGAPGTLDGSFTPAPTGIGCDMTGGSSGGAWFISWGRTNGRTPGFINSVNSYKYPSTQPLAMYGPYIDTLANQVRCAGESSGFGCP